MSPLTAAGLWILASSLIVYVCWWRIGRAAMPPAPPHEEPHDVDSAPELDRFPRGPRRYL